jgi:hypothetical protein
MDHCVRFDRYRFDFQTGQLWSGNAEVRLTPKASDVPKALVACPDDVSALLNAVCLHARLGHKEQALGWLERVFAHGWGKRDWIEHDPDYDSLRDDPRFKTLLAKLK